MKFVTKMCLNFVGRRGAKECKSHANLIDLVKSHPTSDLFAKIGVGAAESESSKVCQKVVRQLGRLN